jgi:hypothetical protein
VFHDNGQSEVIIDQRAAEGGWVSLGIYHFGRVSAALIELSGATDDSGSAVRFDALAWKEIPDSTPPQSQIVRIVHERNGYTVEWSGEDDLSGIAGYDLQVRQLPRGGWRNWVQDKARTSAWFGPHEGRHFAFRVRARDAAGNQEVWRESETGDMDTRQAEEEPEP